MPLPTHTSSIALLAVLSVSCGCQSTHSARVPTRAPAASVTQGGASGPPQASPAVVERPLAMLDDDPITISSMQARLLEQSGAETLRELRLEAALRTALLEAALRVEQQHIDAEEQELLERFSEDEDTALMVLQTLRRNEGLGPERYAALLWRNAALRMLVQGEIDPAPETLERLYRLEYGRKHVIRIVVVPTLQEAQELLEQAQQGTPLAELATHSMDPSRDRGGLVDPFSLEDPSWPQALRTELADLKPGDLTGIVFLEDRYAVAGVEQIVPADAVEFETVRAELDRTARLSQERLKMAELAGRLGVLPRVRILDPELRRAWAVDESASEDR